MNSCDVLRTGSTLVLIELLFGGGEEEKRRSRTSEEGGSPSRLEVKCHQWDWVS